MLALHSAGPLHDSLCYWFLQENASLHAITLGQHILGTPQGQVSMSGCLCITLCKISTTAQIQPLKDRFPGDTARPDADLLYHSLAEHQEQGISRHTGVS